MPTLSDMTYGRSTAGRQSVINTYQSWINSYKKNLKGDQYNKMISAIQNGWNGADADAFIKKLEEITVELERRVNQYIVRMETALKSDASNFAKLQNNNQNNVNSINTRF